MPGERCDMDKLLGAMETGFRPVIVDLLVPSQFLLGVEDLPAVADIVPEPLLHVEVVSVAVLNHVGVTAEGLVAEVALDGRDARVDVVVLHQLLLRHKAFLANVAPVTHNHNRINAI